MPSLTRRSRVFHDLVDDGCVDLSTGNLSRREALVGREFGIGRFLASSSATISKRQKLHSFHVGEAA